MVVRPGKDRGKKAEVVRALPERGQGRRRGREHGQAARQAHPGTKQGGIIDKFMPVHVSTVAVICKACEEPSRIGYRIEEDGQKVRVCRSAEGRCDDDRLGACPRLKERYPTEIRDQLKAELGLGNVMEVPRFEKIVINMGVGRATQQASLIEGAQRDLESITGQKPVVTRAKQSIAGFKLREGQSHRRQGHPAGRPGLGVPRPADQPGDPPHP